MEKELHQKVESSSSLKSRAICNNGHVLIYSLKSDKAKYQSGTYSCKLCNSNYNKCKFGRFACMDCEFDLCLNCRKPDKNLMAKQCPQGHLLQFTKYATNDDETFLCLICQFDLKCFEGRFSCTNCSYNICVRCKMVNINITKQCEKGHSLFYIHPIPGSSEKYTCKNCNKLMNDNQGSYVCSEECNYHICTKCRPSPETILERFPFCPNNHPYYYITQFPEWEQDNKFKCFLCFKKGYIIDGGWYCNLCFLSICSHCRSLRLYEGFNDPQNIATALSKGKVISIIRECIYCNSSNHNTTLKFNCNHFTVCLNCIIQKKITECVICQKLKNSELIKS